MYICAYVICPPIHTCLCITLTPFPRGDLLTAFREPWLVHLLVWMLLHITSLSFQQAKKGLLTLTVRTRLTAPPSLCSHLSPPLCRSLSSSTCVAKESSSPFIMDIPVPPAGAAKPNYRVMVEVSLKKGRGEDARLWHLFCQLSPRRGQLGTSSMVLICGCWGSDKVVTPKPRRGRSCTEPHICTRVHTHTYAHTHCTRTWALPQCE